MIASTPNTAPTFRYSGHETFACRFAWLTKAATAVTAEPDILTTRREDDAMAELGVGKNMVRSIRFWAESAGVLQSCENGHAVSDFGRELFIETAGRRGRKRLGLDPYYNEFKASFAIETLDIIERSLPRKQHRLVQAWAELHIDELKADWELAMNGESVYKIDPLS
jgi:hypothetical protein